MAYGLNSKEEDALWFWQEGLKGWGFRVIRLVCNGGTLPKNIHNHNFREDEIRKIYEICENFESAVKKLPVFKGNEIIRVTGDYRPYELNSHIKFEKYTSFSSNAEYNNSIFRNIGLDGNDSNLFIVDISNSNRKFRKFYGTLKTITDSEKEVLNIENVNGIITDIHNINIGGDPRPDWLGGGYTGGYNFKAHYIKIL